MDNDNSSSRGRSYRPEVIQNLLIYGIMQLIEPWRIAQSGPEKEF